MKLLPRQKKNEFFTIEERHQIEDAIECAEKQTNGEVQVFIESRCQKADALKQAAKIFFSLKMEKTQQRNAVLVYVAIKDRKLAIFGDAGIHKKVGEEYWNHAVTKILHNFNNGNYSDGIKRCVLDIGEALHIHFPYDKSTDKNELPDSIRFGK